MEHPVLLRDPLEKGWWQKSVGESRAGHSDHPTAPSAHPVLGELAWMQLLGDGLLWRRFWSGTTELH